uniref:Translation repressor protein n=1 Tax=viral metagenome TaxID=1070528 RepID=A0A6C0JT40_9ZZZZ
MKNIGVEIELPDDECFLKIQETLTRIGIPTKDYKLFQTAHILHKQGRFWIVHFKEMFILDGRESNVSDDDIARRNTISKLLQDWELVKILNFRSIEGNLAPISDIKIIKHSEKFRWELLPKYTIGKKHFIRK